MFYIGAHMSVAKGYAKMGKEAVQIEANAFQFFTRNPRGGGVKAFDAADADALLAVMHSHSFAPPLAHAPYTLNACSIESRIRAFAKRAMEEDLARLEYFPHSLYNFHPGSHVGQGIAAGIKQIADLLNEVLRPEQNVTVLLETMAGKGSEVGSCFEELAAILELVQLPEKMGVCLDTCHVHDAGYDIVNDLEGVLKLFDEKIGLHQLRAIHLNDSLNPCGSHKDRHAKIGQGFIGLAAIEGMINHPLLRDLPFFLETPNELEGYAAEIKLLRGSRK